MELDLAQKLSLVKLFWNWGYVSDINVKLYSIPGPSTSKIELTDLDVIGFKVNPELEDALIGGDCKTRKGVSPINRAFWLSGVMSDLSVQKGFVVLPRVNEVDHKIAARQQNITLLSTQDLDVYLSKLLPVNFPSNMNMFDLEVWSKFYQEGQSQKSVQQIWDYRRNRFWKDNASTGLRYSLINVRNSREAFTQKNRILNNIFLDVAIAFSISLCRIVANLFQVYLISNSKDDVDEQLRAYIYGGREAYERLDKLRRQVSALRNQTNPSLGKKHSEDSLALPDWDGFLQLFRGALESPADFFSVPKLLKYTLFEKMASLPSGVEPTEAIPNLSNNTAKLALDTLFYFVGATRVPEHTWNETADRLFEVVTSTPSAAAQRLEAEVLRSPMSKEDEAQKLFPPDS